MNGIPWLTSPVIMTGLRVHAGYIRVHAAKLQIITLHKSYVSEVVDPLSGHLANWHGSPDHGPDH